MKGVDIDIPFEEKVDRVSVIVRWIYAIIYGIIGGIIGFFVYIAYALETLVMLILGKRMESLHNFIYHYTQWMTEVHFYVMTTTEEKPPFIPKF